MNLPIEHRREVNHRREGLWAAAMLHRISGVLLACFLPLHFLALGLAIEGEAKLDSFLKWSDTSIVKFSEMGLVFLLCVHLLGGVRLMLIENLPWQPGQKRMAMMAISASVLLALLFVVRVL